MTHDGIDISKFLSKALGIYLLIVSLAMIVNMQEFIVNVNSLINDPPLMFVTGFFTLILGILTVISHNVWQWNWRVIITIFAWLTMFKGASIIWYPHFLDKATLLIIENYTISYIAALIEFALGILLCFFGFKPEAEE